MFAKIVEEWFNHKIEPLKDIVEGINIAAETYDIVENTLHIPSPYSTVFIILVILIIAIILITVAAAIYKRSQYINPKKY